MDEAEFARWVEEVQWRFAKTMPWIPHEYTVGAWGDHQRFVLAKEFITENGYLARWRTKEPNYYYDLDGWRYWSYTSLINRQQIGSRNSEVERMSDGR